MIDQMFGCRVKTYSDPSGRSGHVSLTSAHVLTEYIQCYNPLTHPLEICCSTAASPLSLLTHIQMYMTTNSVLSSCARQVRNITWQDITMDNTDDCVTINANYKPLPPHPTAYMPADR
jgi:hypothetical protein